MTDMLSWLGGKKGKRERWRIWKGGKRDRVAGLTAGEETRSAGIVLFDDIKVGNWEGERGVGTRGINSTGTKVSNPVPKGIAIWTEGVLVEGGYGENG